MRRSNPARKAREFIRAYGSNERVEWVKSLPCVACGVVGYSENAHVASGGKGRKADASQIVPLCGPRMGNVVATRLFDTGCHRSFHEMGRVSFEAFCGVDLDAAAAFTENLWQSHSAERGA